MTTNQAKYVPLPMRGLIAIAGDEARPFLQGLISNDVEKVSPERAIYAALLSPQGKFLHDFIIVALGQTLLLDCEKARVADLGRRLAAYKLRAKITLADATDDYLVAALIGPSSITPLGLPLEAGAARPLGDGMVYCDPRNPALGARALLPVGGGFKPLEAAGLTPAPFDVYERLRLSLGIPDGSRDMAVDKATLLESNFEALNGVDFSKGCYVGQELTARTKYRGLVKRRLMRVRVEGPMPPPGTTLLQNGKEAGEMKSGFGTIGLALIRLDRLEAEPEAPLLADGVRVQPLADGEAP